MPEIQFYGNGTLGYTIIIDSVFNHFFLMQLVSNIIYQIDNHTQVDKEYETEYHFNNGLLEEHVQWVNVAHVTALQTQVQYVYEYVKILLRLKEFTFHCGRSEAELIKKALSKYQQFKTEIIKEAKIKNASKHWGDATGFNKAIWDDLNDEIEMQIIEAEHEMDKNRKEF
jgi:hypothetical protein